MSSSGLHVDHGRETDPETARPGFIVVRSASLCPCLFKLGVTLDDFQGVFWLLVLYESAFQTGSLCVRYTETLATTVPAEAGHHPLGPCLCLAAKVCPKR